MRRMMIGVAAAMLLAGSATAAEYRLQFDPAQGKILKGHGGLQAFDVLTNKTRMRIVAPGNNIGRRGTVRVLVMNLAQPRYMFGPDQVSVELADGTPLPEVAYSVFDKGEKLVEREVGKSRAVDLRQKSGLAALAEQANSGLTAGASQVTGQAAAPADTRTDSLRLDRDSDALPGAKLLGDLNGVLRPLDIGPREAWGGYLIFDMPMALRRAKEKSDQPVTIVVRTGTEVHRIKAVLDRV